MNDYLKRYRRIDLTIFALLAIIAEVVSELALRRYPGAGFHISFSILIGMIAMIRWGYRGAFVYILAGIPMVFLYNGDGSILDAILLYPVANSFVILSSTVFLFIRRNAIPKSNYILFLFELAVFISIAIGKGFSIAIIQGHFFSGMLNQFITQLFSILISFIVLLIVRSNRELLIDMEKYIVTLQMEGKRHDNPK